MANYTVDYNDNRFNQVNTEKQNALNESNNLYNSLLSDSKNLYNQQQNYVNKWETTQNDILDKQLAHQTDLINQQKETAKANTKTETNKALNDYSAYVNPYGYQAERIAANGLSNSGVSETSQLGAYTTYQNRVATANKALQAAITSYDNDINAAVLNNDVQKAQNALEKLQMQLQYTETYYSNKAQYGQAQLQNNQNINNTYYNRYQDVVNQINNENAQKTAYDQWVAEMNEKQRQFDANLAWQKQQAAQEQANWERQYALSQSKAYSSGSGGSSGASGNWSLAEDGGYGLADNIQTDAQKYGTFSNGYQPKGISGHGVLSKTGDTVVVNGKTQNVWKAEDGTLWYWDGTDRTYKVFTTGKSKIGGGSGAFGAGGGGSR